MKNWAFAWFQGYILGNAATDYSIDDNSKVPFAHGMGLISDELYEVILVLAKHHDPSNIS